MRNVNKYPEIVITLLLTFALASVGPVLAAEQKVKAQEGSVKSDGKKDAANPEESNPDDVVPLEDSKVKIQTKTFKPPDDYKFKKFDDRDPEDPEYVDIIPGHSEDYPAEPVKDSATEIQVEKVFDDDVTHAGNFPLHVEGNLQPVGNGGGGETEPPPQMHWAAKIPAVKVEITDTGGASNRKWMFATLPPSHDDTLQWSAECGQADLPVSFRFRRGSGNPTAIGWDGEPSETLPRFGQNKELNYQIELIDGSAQAPKLKVVDGVLQIHSVMHGDVIYVDAMNDEDVILGSDWVHVVKNFTLYDMNRVGAGNLAIHDDWAAVPASLKNAIIKTIIFALEDGPNTDQEALRAAAQQQYENHDPPLAVLDIPSARGIGYLAGLTDLSTSLAGDFYHLHLAAGVIPQSVSTVKEALNDSIDQQDSTLGISFSTGWLNESDRDKYKLRYLNTLHKAKEFLIASVNDVDNLFAVSHSYEFIPSKYYRGQPTDSMLSGDPIRNIRTNIASDNDITLFKTPDPTSAAGWTALFNVSALSQISFFVDKGGRVRLMIPSLPKPTNALMIMDALGDLD